MKRVSAALFRLTSACRDDPGGPALTPTTITRPQGSPDDCTLGVPTELSAAGDGRGWPAGSRRVGHLRGRGRDRHGEHLDARTNARRPDRDRIVRRNDGDLHRIRQLWELRDGIIASEPGSLRAY